MYLRNALTLAGLYVMNIYTMTINIHELLRIL